MKKTMEFTYKAYLDLIRKIGDKGYRFATYQNWNDYEKTVILRHDLDNNLNKAVRLSQIEKECSCSATYFVLVSTNFYNIHSKESRECIDIILRNGGTIGLHFDETQYEIRSEDELKEYVYKEAKVLSELAGIKVDTVSMHRPSEKILSGNIEFKDLINTYSQTYFKDMKYLSDSRRNWRENVSEIIEEETYQRLHILTHPLWYVEGEEKSLQQTLKEVILGASLAYYDNLNDNFRDLEKEVDRAEIAKKLGI